MYSLDPDPIIQKPDPPPPLPYLLPKFQCKDILKPITAVVH